jgi:putative antitoxin of VapBC-like toxin-antitoxin system
MRAHGPNTLSQNTPEQRSGRIEAFCYAIHMKRTNLVLNEHLLAEATRVLQARTYSAAVNQALEEVVRLRKIQSIPTYFGTGIWDGNLAQMREDVPAPRRTRR